MKAYKLIIFLIIIASSFSIAQFTNLAVTTNTADQSEPTVAVSPLNSNNVLAAWNDFRSINGNGFSKPGYAFSTNTGQTWSEALVTPPNYTNGFDPSTAFDRYGNAFYCFIASTGSLGPVYISKTTNFGINWSHAQVSSLTTNQDKPFMTLDNTGGSNDGRIYVSWTDFSSGTGIKFSYSSNHGSTFSTPISLSSLTPNPGIAAQLMPQNSIPGNPASAFLQGSIPAVGPNGEVYVVWSDITTNGGYNGGTFKIRKSTNGGVSFGSSYSVSQFTPRGYSIGGSLDIRTYLPSMAVDFITGNVYVAYTDQASQTNTNPRIKFVRSTNGGSTWSSPAIIADFGTGWQVMPWVTTDKYGRVSVLLIHSSDQTLINSYLTESYDNGVTFSTPLRVSTQSSNPSYASWTHHYNGVANIGGGDSYCIWTDYRNQNADPYFSLANSLYYRATQNTSVTYSATAHNNNHTIERGYSGKVHETFSSFGEIFYRRSSNNGSSWEITKRLSSGNGLNNHPSIVAGYSDVLCAVWQKEIDSRHYSIWSSFSSNMGSSWTTPAVVSGCSNVWISYFQSRDNYGPGSTPVVGTFFRGGAEGIASFVLVYAAENGLHYRFAYTYDEGWTIPGNDIIPGSSGSSSTNWYPSLASYNGQAYTVNLTYDNRFNHVYSQIYNDDYPDGSWSNRVQVSLDGTDNNRLSSIAIDYAGNTLAAWSGWNGSNYSVKFRQGFANGTWSTWSKAWTISGVESYNPAITYYNKGGNYPYGIDIIWYTSANQIRQKKYYGLGDTWIPADPNTQLLASNGLNANLTHERQNTTVPIQTWTNQTTSPTYSIVYNSSYLPKENLIASGEIRRAAVIGNNSNNSGLSIELSQPVIKLSSGESMVIPFKDYDYSAKLDLSLSNVFDYLQTESLAIPENAESISFNVVVKSSRPDTLADGILNASKQTPFENIALSILAKDGAVHSNLASLINQNLDDKSGIHNFSKTFEISASTVKNKNIFLIPKVEVAGTFNEKDLQFSLENISIEHTAELAKDIISETVLPKEYMLEQNYPNPFNPATEIKYAVKEDGLVTLKVFDLLGREIATLINENKPAGIYTVNFDAGKLSSGVYFYSITVGNFHQTKKMLLMK